MRNETTKRNFLLLTILALSLTLTPAMFARQRSVVSAASDSIQEDRQAIPANKDCITLSEYVAGNATDNFGGVEATSLSPGLQAYFTANNLKPRQFDDPGLDKAFGHSFFIKCCKVCRAELEIRVSRQGPLDFNDVITIGQAPFTTNKILSNCIWPGNLCTPPPWALGSASPKVMNIALSAAALNKYIMDAWKSDNCKVPLDIYLQDDTAVDYVKLKIWN